MKSYKLLSAIAALTLAACLDPNSGKPTTEELLSAMTLEEKAHLVVGTGQDSPFSNGKDAVIGESYKILPGAAGTTFPVERLGIPAAVLADGPAGLRISPTRDGDTATYYCTHFPIGTLLACTWNQELVETVGEAMGREVLEYGADIYLAPALNIQRNPLCGRNFEYYSEDPLVSGKIAAAYVLGVQSNGVGTSVKHFAANNQETYRTGSNSIVSTRAMREIYLKPFEITVKEGKPWTVMSSYNKLNGIYTSQNPELLTTLLREEWGFDGLVMTDWNGGKDPVEQMKAGNDMLQPGGEEQSSAIIEAVRSGSLDKGVLDRNVTRVLNLLSKTPSYNGYKHSDNPDLQAHAAVTRQSATEGMVLLKNEGSTLPIASTVKNIALFGNCSYDFIAGGTGSGDVNRAYTVSLLDGLNNAGYEIDRSLQKAYDNYLPEAKAGLLPPPDHPFYAYAKKSPVIPEEMDASMDIITEAAKNNDIALITIGRKSGEGIERKTTDFNLSAAERRLIKNVCSAFHSEGKKVVVVLNIGGVIETASWKDYPDAILCAWQGGQEGGNSVADLLKGNATPSGKLTMTFPVKLEDHASSANFPIDAKVSHFPTEDDIKQYDRMRNIGYTVYEEDIYVGYRYFDSFGIPVSYPFGYGLSYTTFKYDNATISQDSGTYTVTVDITNTGDCQGKEVVQLYVAAPDSKTLNKPEKELKAFAKTRLLTPGEMTKVTLSVDAADLASYDEEKSAWVVSQGTYKFLVAASSADIKASLEANVEAQQTKTADILKPQQVISVLRR